MFQVSVGELFGLLGMFLVSLIKSGVFAQYVLNEKNRAFVKSCIRRGRCRRNVQYIEWLFT